MKTQFSHRRNALISKQTLIVASSVAGVCAVVLVVSSFFPSLPLVLATPGWKLGAVASNATHAVTSVFQNTDLVVADKERLDAENQMLNNENRVLRTQLEDISRLTGGGVLSTHRVVASVISRPPLSPYDTLIVYLNNGSSVPLDAFVYGPGSVPIGKVTQSARGMARVLLYSSPNEKTEGWIGEKRLPVTLLGESAGSFSATLARESGVAVGDILYLPGPGALPAGTVVDVASDPSSTNDVVHIVPYVNIFSLTWVSIQLDHE